MHTVKWSKYCYLTLIILLNINHFFVNSGLKYCYLTIICLHTVEWLKSSIWPIDGTLSGLTTLSQSGPESNSNEEVLQISQSSRTWASPSDGLVSDPRHSSRGDHTSLPRYSWHILQLQPTELFLISWSEFKSECEHWYGYKTFHKSYLFELLSSTTY